ncbi:MAG: Ig-like domain-containing protein, partial [Rudanella sp.]|nr:Ig-like domain-containing protein [Rudanella sp.]
NSFTAVAPASLTVAPTGPTTSTAPVISGTTTPGATVVITGPGPATLCTATADASGVFSCSVTVPAGPNTVTVTACTTGGCSTTTTSFTAVDPPTVAILSPATNGTATTTPTVSGTATPLASVTVLGPNSQSCVTTASSSGTYACASLTFAAGPNSVTAIASNAGGTSMPVVNSFTAIAPCTTPTMGGTATLSGGNSLTLCSPTNGGNINLTGQTGTVIRWETSTNNGGTWTPITSTAGLTTYSFTNAANQQQYRAVVNNGGSCADATAVPLTITTSASACSADCNYNAAVITK